MSATSKDEEITALRALLKEALAYGNHGDNCQVWRFLAELPEGVEPGIAEEKACDCWIHFALREVVEAEQREAVAARHTQRVWGVA